MGFPKSRAVKAVLPRLLCVVCKDILQLPIQCSACNTVICAECQRPNICPCGLTYVPAAKALVAKLNSVLVTCDIGQCAAKVKICHLAQHEAKCGHLEVEFHCTKGCGTLLRDKQAFESHDCRPAGVAEVTRLQAESRQLSHAIEAKQEQLEAFHINLTEAKASRES